MKYFAYGSNMENSQMIRRCPNFKLLGRAKLNGFKLDFTKESSLWEGGVADIVKNLNNHVWGLLYELTEQDLDSLDTYEACSTYYKRKNISVEYKSKNVEVIAYEVVNKEPFILPSRKYMNVIIKAAIENYFPKGYVDFLKSIKTNS